MRTITKSPKPATAKAAAPRSPLASVLFGKSMQAILAQLFGRPDEEFYLREIARAAGTGASSLQRELAALAHAGIIERKVHGHQVYFRANRACPIYEELRGLVVKTFGVTETLTVALQPLAKKIDAAFIYGSVARGEERAGSDIDLFIIGSATFAEVVQAVTPAQEKLGREINPTVYPRVEFVQTVRDKSHFVDTVLSGRKLYLMGSDDELERLAGKGNAAPAPAVKKRARRTAGAGGSKPR